MRDDEGKRWWRRLLILPPLLLGIGLVLGASQIKKPADKVKRPEKPVSVRVIKATKAMVVPRVRGYGIMHPAQVWQGIAKVSGPVDWLNPKLKAGVIMPMGKDLIRIEQTEFNLVIEQIDAEMAASGVKTTNTKQLIKIEARNIALLKNDLDRKQVLRKQGTISQVSVDAAIRAHLAAQTKVQGLKNTIALLTAEQKVMRVRRANASLNAKRTLLKAPFDLRVTEVLTEKAQYANKGQVLMKADGIREMEVTAHIPIGRLRYLVRGTGGADWLRDASEGKLSGPFKLKARVHSHRPHGKVSWPARVSRIAESLDPQTQTVGIVVTVDEPYKKAIPGIRPILVPNTFVEVDLTGKPLKNQIIIPQSALHQGRVYISNAEKRLEIKRVKIKFRQSGYAVIASGINEGDKIILTDLIPAIKGMLLKPKGDKAALKNLLLKARGGNQKAKKEHKQ